MSTTAQIRVKSRVASHAARSLSTLQTRKARHDRSTAGNKGEANPARDNY
jgi:hypothetical protein